MKVRTLKQHSPRSRSVTAIDRQGQLADGAFEAAALAQHHGLLGQHGGRITGLFGGAVDPVGCVLRRG